MKSMIEQEVLAIDDIYYIYSNKFKIFKSLISEIGLSFKLMLNSEQIKSRKQKINKHYYMGSSKLYWLLLYINCVKKTWDVFTASQFQRRKESRSKPMFRQK